MKDRCTFFAFLGSPVTPVHNTKRFMPRYKRGKKRRQLSDSEEEESEYEEEEEEEEEEEVDDDDDDDENEELVEDDADDAEQFDGPLLERKKSAPVVSSHTKKKKSATVPTADVRSSYDRNGHRLTERGGYSHKDSSKLKISLSNKGKTPWNKDKHRSGTDKAKISAGVKARNRAVLMQKLKEWDMTEEEFLALKKKTKTVRERLRRTRVANQTKSSKDTAKLEPESESDIELDDEENPVETDQQQDAEVNQYVLESEAMAAEIEQTTALLANEPEEERVGGSDQLDAEASLSVQQEIDEPSTGDFCWEPHPFDSTDPSIYAEACPKDGPGGLICCSICTANYSRYLSSTYSNMQEQTISLIGQEAKELSSFLRHATGVIEGTMPGTAPTKHAHAKQS